MAEVIISTLIGGVSFITGILAAVKMTGKKEQKVDDRLEHLAVKSHSAPCPVITEIKVGMARLEGKIDILLRNGK
jgi:hypothetical protein